MATPAEPLLASIIYDHHLVKQSIDDVLDGDIRRPRKRQRLVTECKSVDSALVDGLSRGEGGLVCVSGEPRTGGREISQHLLISHLLSHPAASATIIDTLGSLDILGLYKTIVARLKKYQVTRPLPNGKDAGEYATSMLDRVKVMRVFDFEGMLEGIAELREDLEGRQYAAESTAMELNIQDDVQAPRGTVADSQDEDDEDEMLLSPDPGQDTTNQETTNSGTVEQPSILQRDKPDNGILIIDNLTQVISPLLKNNYAQGQTLLTTFLRSLAHMTTSHNLCAILLNTLVTYRVDTTPTPSIFTSVTARPALGKTFTYCLDVHLLVSRVPKGVGDAKSVYAASQQVGEGRKSETRQAQWVSVVEVLQDRYGDRTGRFGIFDIDSDGMLRDVF